MATHIEGGEYVTSTEAAAILNIGRARVTQLMREDKLPSILLGNVRVLPLQAVEERGQRLREELRRLETLGEMDSDGS